MADSRHNHGIYCLQALMETPSLIPLHFLLARLSKIVCLVIHMYLRDVDTGTDDAMYGRGSNDAPHMPPWAWRTGRPWTRTYQLVISYLRNKTTSSACGGTGVSVNRDISTACEAGAGNNVKHLGDGLAKASCFYEARDSTDIMPLIASQHEKCSHQYRMFPLLYCAVAWFLKGVVGPAHR